MSKRKDPDDLPPPITQKKRKRFIRSDDDGRSEWLKHLILVELTPRNDGQKWFSIELLMDASNTYRDANRNWVPGPLSNSSGYGLPDTSIPAHSSIEYRRKNYLDKAIQELIEDGHIIKWRSEVLGDRGDYFARITINVPPLRARSGENFGESESFQRGEISRLASLQGIPLRPITHKELVRLLNELYDIENINFLLRSKNIKVSREPNNNWTATSGEQKIQITTTDQPINGNNILEAVVKAVVIYRPSYIERFIETIRGIFRR